MEWSGTGGEGGRAVWEWELHFFMYIVTSGMLAQLPLNTISTRVLKGGTAGNLLVWGSLILGQPLAILMYVHDWYVGVRNGKVEKIWPITARGLAY